MKLLLALTCCLAVSLVRAAGQGNGSWPLSDCGETLSWRTLPDETKEGRSFRMAGLAYAGWPFLAGWSTDAHSPVKRADRVCGLYRFARSVGFKTRDSAAGLLVDMGSPDRPVAVRPVPGEATPAEFSEVSCTGKPGPASALPEEFLSGEITAVESLRP
ncbi:MAG: hypothetical protein HZB91_06125 [Elusimicrobia bacterium]|nr:hypothetical protein [Elusimicrobiota bacterium]